MQKEPEIQILNDRINSLESTIIRGVEASEKVSLSVNKLLHEFQERDIRHEYERAESARLTEKVVNIDTTITNYIKDHQPILERAKKGQDFRDDILKGMSTTTGKLVIGIAILGVMVTLGLDPRNLMIKP